MRSDTKKTRDFYDLFGWRRAGEKTFNDSAVFVDARPVLDFYKRRVFDRVSKDLKRKGKYFLDAGSGALPNTNRAAAFERIVCVDLSLVGVIEAQKKLGERGCCVVADLAQLPFRDDVFDAILCSHALYHMPKDSQALAMTELYRTLHPSERCVVIYNGSPSLIETLAAHLDTPGLVAKVRQLVSLLRDRSQFYGKETPSTDSSDRREPAIPSSVSLYFYAHRPEWFIENAPHGARIRIKPWESVGQSFTRSLVPNNPIGKGLLLFVLLLETICPRIMVRYGAYFYVVLRKP